MATKKKNGAGTAILQTGTAIVATGIGYGAGQIADANMQEKAGESTLDREAKVGAVGTGASLAVAGAGLAMMKGKSTKKYAAPVIGGALLATVFNAVPVAKWVGSKLAGLFKKNPAEGTKGYPRGSGAVSKLSRVGEVHDGVSRNLID